MKAKYIGLGDAPPLQINFLGLQIFKLNEVADVENLALQEKIRNHRSFEVVEDDIENAVIVEPKKRGRPKKGDVNVANDTADSESSSEEVGQESGWPESPSGVE